MMKPTFTFQGKAYQAMLFDMDGTLIDNMMIHHEAWRVALAEHGIIMSLDEVKAQVHGVNHEILKRLFGDRFSTAQAIEFSNQKEAAYRRIYAEHISLIEGVAPFLQCAKKLNVPMALATAAPVENVEFVFAHLPIQDYFGAVKHAGDVTRGKPDPQVFELAAQALGVDLRQCLIFEDSITGAQAAHNAQADALIITSTHARPEFDAIDNIVAFCDDYVALEIAPI